MNTFGRRLSQALSARGMTQSDLAAKAGVTTAAVSHYVRGNRLPQMKVLVRIAAALDVPIQELLDRPDYLVEEDELRSACRIVTSNVNRLTESERAEIILIMAGLDL